ncbi:MAG: choice-of-anchor tandem repeat GloVer-containing protein [Terriglobales bacterium]
MSHPQECPRQITLHGFLFLARVLLCGIVSAPAISLSKRTGPGWAKGFSIALSKVVVVVLGILMAATPSFAAGKEHVLRRFNGNDGSSPWGDLIFDASGNLYGTTSHGNVFELTRGTNGTWTEKVLHNFKDPDDGWDSLAGLILDAAGNLYGTTHSGGGTANCGENPPGCGTVFELTPGADGKWVEKVLHRFKYDGKDGIYPAASLIFDAAGNLYGTTEWGGPSKSGTVFELIPSANATGSWTEKLLDSQAVNPVAALIFDAVGNLYGTTLFGGAYGGGSVFELTPHPNGTWTERVIYSFTGGSDGGQPTGGVIFDGAGNLYGTTFSGGTIGDVCFTQSCGVVFELIPDPRGSWTQKVLYTFKYDGKDGTNPAASMIFDAAGNLYSTTYTGGANGAGTVFELTPAANGRWIEKVLYSFNFYSGGAPAAALIFDAAGNLYSTATAGGDGFGNCPPWGCGAIFELIPSGAGHLIDLDGD